MESDHPLAERLRSLHELLSQTKEVDKHTIELLSTLTDDIHRILQQVDEARAEEVEPVKNRMQEVLRKFEAEHPQLASAIEQVTDGLANLGI